MTGDNSTERRWEHGSEMAWPACAPVTSSERGARSAWPADAVLCGSGRDALRLLLSYGREQRGWQRLLLPSFFCQDVVEPLAEELPVALYRDDPTQERLDLAAVHARTGDVVMTVNYFGLRGATSMVGALPSGAELIEDHTHDPWAHGALQSGADWCVASLRKTLPIPDGGIAWSPRGHAMPSVPAKTAERRTASLEKLAGMVLKRVYLDGAPVEKDTFRALLAAGEAHIAAGDISAMPDWTRALLPTFPMALWRERRARNHRAFVEAFGRQEWGRVLAPADESGVCPFSVMLVVDSPARRAGLRAALIDAHIYPAVLWSLEQPVVPGIPEADVDLSRRLLSLHCDARYSEDDMRRVARSVIALGASLHA